MSQKPRSDARAVTNTTHRQPRSDARAVLKGTLLLAGGLLLAARGERR